jgi:ATP-dependent 26S proteasome regulatory subunit
LAVLLRGSDSRGVQQNVSLEIMAADTDHAARSLAAIRDVANERNVFRGQVLSFGSQMFGPDQAPIVFEHRGTLERSALILPDEILTAIEQQVIGVAAHRDRLLASGQHLKRGLLLHGAPGTGKTHTVRYLISKLPELTVVILTGEALHLVGAACSIARTLAPAIIVIEDVDLIAEHRGMHPGQHPMLFQLLNEMDGLAEDVDVTFILTTNRADLLEPALAARPGRVDQAVGFQLPDADARRRLLELYRGRLTLDLRDSDLVIERTDGVTASFLKELLRKAALIAADQDVEGTGALTVTSEHLTVALDSLLDERNEMTRLLLGARPE